MSSKPDDVTKTNEQANRAFNGKPGEDKKRTEDGTDITAVNEAANAEFNADEAPANLSNRVGGLRGSSD